MLARRYLPRLARGAVLLMGAHTAIPTVASSCAPAPKTRHQQARQGQRQAAADGRDASTSAVEQHLEQPLEQLPQRDPSDFRMGNGLREVMEQSEFDETRSVEVQDAPARPHKGGDSSSLENAEARHKLLGVGAIRKGPNDERNGRVLFEWTRTVVIGRNRKRQKETFNRWLPLEELEILERQARPEAEDESEEELPVLVDAPSKADHERSRKPREKLETHNPWQVGGAWKSKTVQHISAHQMIRDHFPNDFLVPDAVKRGAVFCRACKKNYPLIKSSLTAHTQCEKHQSAIRKLVEKTDVDAQIKTFLEDYFKEHPQEATATLSTDVHLYRYRVTEALLGNGIPLNKAYGLRPLLERSGVALTDPSHLASMIPRILEREKNLLKEEIKGQYITFVFDGTTRLGEAVNVVVRFCPSDFNAIQQRLVNFTTLKKHLNGNELGRHLMDVLRELHIPYEQVVGSSRDSCATNGAGLRVIKPFLPSMMDVLCYSHMLQGTGSRLQFKSLDTFLTPFITLQTMAIVKSLWKEIVGTSMKGYSHIRWWSRWELMKDLATAFGSVLDQFVAQLIARDIAEETTKKLKAVLDSPDQRSTLELELAVAMDLEPLVKATYLLEGDGLCLLKAYDVVEDLRKLGRSLDAQESLPNAAAVLRSRAQLEEGVKFRQYWSEKDCPGGSGWYEGHVLGKKPGHGHLCAVRYSNGDEMWIMKAEEKAFRGNILAHMLIEWQVVRGMVQPAFDYIESRLTDHCDAPYHMQLQHAQMRQLKVHYIRLSHFRMLFS